MTFLAALAVASTLAAPRYDTKIVLDGKDTHGRHYVRVELHTLVAMRDPFELWLSFISDGLEHMNVPRTWQCGPSIVVPLHVDCRVFPFPETGSVQTVQLRYRNPHFADASVAWTERGHSQESSSRSLQVRPYARDFVVTNTADSGEGSLRQAMLDLNASCANEERCRVSFALPPAPPGQWHTIRPLTPLPLIRGRGYKSIDGTTQTAVRDSNPLGPEIELDGSGVEAGSGIEIGVGAGTMTLSGLAIHSFPRCGIEVRDHETTIEHSFIGIDPTGREARPNGSHGIAALEFWVSLRDSVISGNRGSGVFVQDSTLVADRNRIGVAAHADDPVPNGESGIFAGWDSFAYIAANVIAYNGHAGFATVITNRIVRLTDNRIFGNGQGPIGFFPTSFNTLPWPEAPLLLSARVGLIPGYTVITAATDAEHPVSISFYLANAAGEPIQYLGRRSAPPGAPFEFRVRGDLRGQLIVAQLLSGERDERGLRRIRISRLTAPIEAR